MADFGAPVAQGVDPMKGLSTLSDLMTLKSKQIGIQQQQQTLETGQSLQQSAQAGAIQDQQKAKETQNIAQALQDPIKNGILKPDGTPADGAMAKILQIAPSTGAVRANEIFSGAKQKVEFDRSINNLTEEKRSALAADMSSAAASGASAEDTRNLLAKHVEQNPGLAKGALIMSSMLPKDPTMTGDPQQDAQTNQQYQAKLKGVQTLIGRSAMGPVAAGGLNTVSTNAVDEGTNINLLQTTPGGSVGSAGSLGKGIAPGRQPFTDSFGRVFNFNPQNGSYEPAQSGGQGGATSSGGTKPTGPGAAAPGDVEAIKSQTETNFANVNANRQGANAAPQQLDQIRNALNLAEKTNTGGDWTASRARIESNLASVIPGLKSAKDDASKVQELDKFLERITNDSTRVLGQNATTDAQRDSLHRQNATTGYTNDAIKAVLKYGAAQTMAMQAKGNAQDAWLKQKGNGITNQHDFETQWRQSYDPVLFQLEAATPAERTKLIQSLPPEEAASLASKRAGLKELGAVVK